MIRLQPNATRSGHRNLVSAPSIDILALTTQNRYEMGDRIRTGFKVCIRVPLFAHRANYSNCSGGFADLGVSGEHRALL